jgi:transposase
VRKNLFWLNDVQWKRIEPYLPTDVGGVGRADDRRVISGIVHVLKSGCRWSDCPPEYGPPTTSIIALCAGRGAAYGKTCSGNFLPRVLSRNRGPQ